MDPEMVAENGVVQPDSVDLQASSLVETARDATRRRGRDGRTEGPLEDTVLDRLGATPTPSTVSTPPAGCGMARSGGKTSAGALAGELGRLPRITPANVTSKFVGKSADNVAKVFEVARANAPCVLFIDEIDGIAGSRRGSMNTSEQQLVNQLLTELEGAAADDIVVVAATNFVEASTRRYGARAASTSAWRSRRRMPRLAGRYSRSTCRTGPSPATSTGTPSSSRRLATPPATSNSSPRTRLATPCETARKSRRSTSNRRLGDPSSIADWDDRDRYQGAEGTADWSSRP